MLVPTMEVKRARALKWHLKAELLAGRRPVSVVDFWPAA